MVRGLDFLSTFLLHAFKPGFGNLPYTTHHIFFVTFVSNNLLLTSLHFKPPTLNPGLEKLLTTDLLNPWQFPTFLPLAMSRTAFLPTVFPMMLNPTMVLDPLTVTTNIWAYLAPHPIIPWIGQLGNGWAGGWGELQLV